MNLTRLTPWSHEFYFNRSWRALDDHDLPLHHKAGEKHAVKRQRNQDRRDSDARCRSRIIQRVGSPVD